MTFDTLISSSVRRHDVKEIPDEKNANAKVDMSTLDAGRDAESVGTANSDYFYMAFFKASSRPLLGCHRLAVLPAVSLLCFLAEVSSAPQSGPCASYRKGLSLPSVAHRSSP